MENTCKNCGAWKGLHHYETMQCPRDGMEAPLGREQLWETTTYRSEHTKEELELLSLIEGLTLENKALRTLYDLLQDGNKFARPVDEAIERLLKEISN